MEMCILSKKIKNIIIFNVSDIVYKLIYSILCSCQFGNKMFDSALDIISIV